MALLSEFMGAHVPERAIICYLAVLSTVLETQGLQKRTSGISVMPVGGTQSLRECRMLKEHVPYYFYLEYPCLDDRGKALGVIGRISSA